MPLLIAYGSKHGSTQEVAEAIARRLRMAGLEVDLRPAAEVGDVTSYEGVVLGGALYFGCWHPDAARFFADHRHEFAERPPAIFAVGPRTADARGLAESRTQLDKALAKVPEVEPRLVAVFGGVVDPTKLRFPLSRMPASDAHDWDAIDEWAGEAPRRSNPTRLPAGRAEAMAVREHLRLQEVDVQALDAARLEPLIGPERIARYEGIAEATESAMRGRTVLNVNSTAAGGGVAEMLQTLLAYGRGAGLDIRWLVIQGDAGFFEITKRVHNGLYGSPGDGGALGDAERSHYKQTLRRNADELLALVRPDDVVLIHDPQPAGLAAAMASAGAKVVWRCHVGADEPNEWTERSWSFLRPYLEDVDAFVFSRYAFAPSWAEESRTHVIPPSIDPFSAKNEPISQRNVRLILGYTGLIAGNGEVPAVPFTRRDGSPGRINRRVDVLQTGPPPPADAPLVVQVSRWDRMKDMPGVMSGFADHVDHGLGAHLLLAGPAVTGVADDPEAAAVLEECIELWRALPRAARSRVHLACTPMADPDEAAAIVNALQRHAAVVVQKSIAEGFGLTVAEAMWKSRPIVASAVGGIVDQIVSGAHGLLIADPSDLPSFGNAVETLLRDRTEAGRLGTNARARADAEFLGDRHLVQYGRLLAQLG